ncbi:MULTISPECIES: hypothetical protein [Stutzerimonas stutzeri subgroup]|jgi:hypothetical protein|uniref:hypothetical protein n=1 Tax=Stutzerimonas stutzeri subgroup TaxID=578833 RepID=UPI000F77BFE6|nr:MULTISPECIES: hypothetical protein [Stutzerimonas stutzeri subgroup]MBL4860318.1 hypothetical protein [Acinetobacter sp.]MCQ4292014.1 hypothetical protein [Stutzerimonas stutzeri]WOF79986.1 hypothetical protein P5704_005705 [Pseudomonas sp. FeN3W]
MPNYFVINKPSNLVLTVVSLKYTPAETKVEKFIPASDRAIAALDKWLKANPGMLIDVGDLMSRSKYLEDYVVRTRNDKSQTPKATPQRIYYRDEQIEKHVDRLTAVCNWIAEHPEADEHGLSEAFGMGTVAAKAYLAKYSQ